jgi:WD40 repeat protein
MSSRLVRRLLSLVMFLFAPAALGADPLPEGATARFVASGVKYSDPIDAPVIVSQEGELLSPSGVSLDGKLQARISDDHTVRVCVSNPEQELRQLKGHTAYLTATVFSPDGKIIASGSNDRTLRLWDTASGKELHCCRGHDDQVCAIAFAPDGKTVASAGWDGTVRLWDVASGKEIWHCEGHRYEVRTVAFAPDGKTLASGGTDGTVRIWNAATGKEVRGWTVHESDVMALAFTKDGKGIGTVDPYHPQGRLWDMATGKELGRFGPKGFDPPRSFPGPNLPPIYSAAFAPNGKTVALGYGDGTVRLHDATNGKELRILGRHPGYVWSVAFSPDGKTLASSARRHGVVRLWDVETGKMVRSYPGHGGGVSRVLFTPDGKQLVAAGGSFDPSIIVYDTATAKGLHRLEGHTNYVEAIALAPDSKTLASAAWDKTVRLWDMAAGKERLRWAGAESSDGRVAFSADGSCVLATDAMGNPCLYDVATGKRRGSLERVSRWVGMSADGHTLAAATPDNLLSLVEVATGQERRRFNDGGRPSAWMIFSPDGRRLLSDAGNGTAFLWDLTAGARSGLTAHQGDDLWDNLAGADGPRAYDALWRLALSPKESVPLLREKLRPAGPVDGKPIPRWIKELDDDNFDVREKATKNLERTGEAARAALEKAVADSTSAEVKQRAGSLLAKLDDGTPGADELHGLRALEVLEQVGTPEARQIIEGLTKGAPEVRLTREAKAALRRLPK